LYKLSKTIHRIFEVINRFLNLSSLETP